MGCSMPLATKILTSRVYLESANSVGWMNLSKEYHLYVSVFVLDVPTNFLCGLLSVACLIPDVSYLRFTAGSMSSKVIKKQQEFWL